MINTKMTLAGKVFMGLFLFVLGICVGGYVGFTKGKKYANEGVHNETNVTIENLKAKEGSEIVIDTDSEQKAEQKKEEEPKKKFLGIF